MILSLDKGQKMFAAHQTTREKTRKTPQKKKKKRKKKPARTRSAIRDSQHPSSPIGFLFLKLPPPPCAALLELQPELRPFGDSYLVPIPIIPVTSPSAVVEQILSPIVER